MGDFGHCHVHTEYSTLDGMGKIKEMLERAMELGQKFIVITDHGTMSGLLEAQQLGEKLGIKVLLGCEFYYQRENDDGNGHVIVIAKNNKGLENMMKLHEYGYVENFHYKPRITWEKLKEYSEGLVVTSACMASTFSQYIMSGETLEAKAWARKFKDVFGEDFYLEIQPNEIPEQLETNKTTIRIAKDLDIKVIATNDVHYVYKSDAFPHEVQLALQVGKKMSDPKRWRFPTNDFWLKSKQEMIDTFIGLDNKDVIDALNNTSEIADKCDAKYVKGNYLPEYHNIPEGETPRSLLVKRTKDGVKREGVGKDIEFMQQVQNEIDVIDRNGYSGYYMIVQDFVNFGRKNGVIVGDGRGSGAGSKVAWLTEITKIPPHHYDLLFERFLADGREPDFDIDFSDQDAIFDYLASVYGWENVARVIAFGRLTPRAVSRKVLSAFDAPIEDITIISKLIPDLCHSLEVAYKNQPKLLEYKEKYKGEFEVIQRLEGIVSHESQHAGGVIICKDLSSKLPVKTKAEDRRKRIVAFDKEMLHDLGHYKFDILGLETLPTIKRCLNSILETGVEIDLHTIDLEDQNVYDMLCTGDVSGIFQLANQAQKVIEQQPRNFRDIIAINALIRPGVGDWHEYIARRNGKAWSVHPDRMPYMAETLGLITYQEQFLLDCKVLAGWDIAYADKHVRKNKDIRNDAELQKKFLDDSTSRGYDLDEMVLVWDEIMDAVDKGYSFNKSHSASYGVTSYQTAWLKCYYPEHFYASLMSSEKTDGEGQNAVAGYIAECKKKGIKVLPPDINASGEDFIVKNGGINYRITTITNVGESAIKSIKKIRPILSFDDFMERKEKKDIKKNVSVNLIKAGCFDFDNPNRAELLWKFDMSQRTKTQIKDDYQCPLYEWNDRVKAEWERESVGMYLSIHPMERYGFKPLTDYNDGSNCIQGGEIYDVKKIFDKKGNEMAFVFINTLYGNVKLLVFAGTWKYKKYQELLQVKNIILVRGKRSGDSVILDDIELLD